MKCNYPQLVDVIHEISTFIVGVVTLLAGLVSGCASAQLSGAHHPPSSQEEAFIDEIARNPEINYDNMFQRYPHRFYDESRWKNFYLR